MGLFHKDRVDTGEITRIAGDDATICPPAAQDAADQALDTLASVLRSYGSHGFDIEAMDVADLEQQCEAWTRHILTGTAAPADDPSAEEPDRMAPVAMDQRHWTDLQRFFRSHRCDEQAAVQGRTEGMRSLVSDLAHGLRSAINDDSAKDEMVALEMAALGAAVEGDSLEAIREQLARAVGTVSRVIRERQERYEAQLQSMGERVRTLHADLVAVREKVNLDALTHLHNRGAFDRVIARQIEYSFLSGQPMALMMLDLDNFKQINDSYGHPAGDLVLQHVANALVRAFPRRSDFVARYGGEEFAVILVDVEPADLVELGERVLDAIRDLKIDYQDHCIRPTGSAGIAAGTTQDSPETLLSRADKALYQAKQTGRDRVVLAEMAETGSEHSSS